MSERREPDSHEQQIGAGMEAGEGRARVGREIPSEESEDFAGQADLRGQSKEQQGRLQPARALAGAIRPHR